MIDTNRIITDAELCRVAGMEPVPVNVKGLRAAANFAIERYIAEAQEPALKRIADTFDKIGKLIDEKEKRERDAEARWVTKCDHGQAIGDPCEQCPANIAQVPS